MRARVAARARHRAASRELCRRIPRARVSSISWTSIAPAARPIRTCCATARSSSACACATRSAWARSWFATGHYARRLRRRGRPGAATRRAIEPRISPTSCTRCSAHALRARAVPARGAAQARGARAGAPRRPAGARQARQHRHLLHRRAPVRANSWRASSTPRPARSRASTGSLLGQHRGLPFYTLGQRAGLDDRRRARLRAGAVVRRAQGQRAQRADRRAAARAALPRGAARLAPGAVNWLCRSRAAAAFAARCSCATASRRRPPSVRAAGRRQRPDRVRAAAARRDARASSRCSTSRTAAWAAAVDRARSASSGSRRYNSLPISAARGVPAVERGEIHDR